MTEEAKLNGPRRCLGSKDSRDVTAKMYDEETRAAYPSVSRRERRSGAEAGVVMVR